MEKIENDLVSVPSELNDLKEHLQGNITVNYDMHTLTLDSKVGKGQVRYTNLQSGLQTFDFNLKLIKDIEIPIDSITSESIQFLYCLDGKCYHQFETFEKATLVEQFQTAVAHSDKSLASKIIIKKDAYLTLNIICVNKKEYFDKFSKENNPFGKKLQGLLYDIGTKSKHFHLGSYSLKIAEQLKLLFGIEYGNEVSELLSQKGRYYLILAEHIEQFHAEIENNSNTSGLLKNELMAISQVSDFIKEHPEIQHSIKSLCLESGLSPAKLQEGFKFMFQRTVSDFVRNVRLEKAEKLIKTTELTISEVVYSVGLTSRSYFCKIFKKKYSCSPKEYKSR
ncbi:AraC family transcriptional regulator [Aquimarina sp. BL5]|uniref:helix-turn-helix transcriptional regulator n=1 Tax=Aquimarina sp. BL5 TaxID=1714860 RepID=UPI000E53B9E0|nr:AraC family transcriptional regulator [Aquimarina sp. BL5]AXT53055.1 AraC family transcriptional regulator [Aquimarina sp. BL5]RKM91332.1 helix-turn-helix domain-containing protein [Aquimarina sp. BL5]